MSPSPKRALLLPLIPLYRFALAVRGARLRTGLERVRKLSWPVVSVGSLSAGGAGKTPMTIALAQQLAGEGMYVDVLSRGYGRRSGELARVHPEGAASEFGDEPLLMAQQASVPVFVASQRFDAGLLAESEAKVQCASSGSTAVHLLDDGFQHRQLHRDVDILLISESDWRDRLLPAGNLREPRSAIKRASVIAIPADEPDLERELRAWGWTAPVWKLRRRIEVPAVRGAVAAFCGIARPAQFFAGLERAGLRLVARTAFRDHFQFDDSDLKRLNDNAHAAGASALITTEKDLVRMRRIADSRQGSMPLLAARLTIAIEDEERAKMWLLDRVAQVRAQSPM